MCRPGTLEFFSYSNVDLFRRRGREDTIPRGREFSMPPVFYQVFNENENEIENKIENVTENENEIANETEVYSRRVNIRTLFR